MKIFFSTATTTLPYSLTLKERYEYLQCNSLREVTLLKKSKTADSVDFPVRKVTKRGGVKVCRERKWASKWIAEVNNPHPEEN